MVKEFNSIEEIQKYYDKETNTYIFKEDGEYIDLVIFNFDLSITSNINARDIFACDINACDINACDINACDISACDINACDISAYNINARNIDCYDINAINISAENINAEHINYFAVCFAYKNITCVSIEGRKPNAKHFVFDGKIKIIEEN